MTAYTTAFTKNAVGPRAEYRKPATTDPTPTPPRVATSKRATTRPRRAWSREVAMAMYPRAAGTLAAAAAPSRKRVPASSGTLVVSAVPITAMPPRIGPGCIIRCAPNRSAMAPNRGDRMSSAAKYSAARSPAVTAVTATPPYLGRSVR